MDAFKQLLEYASQDSDPKLVRAAAAADDGGGEALKKRLADTEPKHLEGVLEFAGRAYRRPLTRTDRDELTGLYANCGSRSCPTRRRSG